MPMGFDDSEKLIDKDIDIPLHVQQVFQNHPDILNDLNVFNVNECHFKASFDPVNLKNIIRFFRYYYNVTAIELYKNLALKRRNSNKTISRQTFYTWISETTISVNPTEEYWEQILDYCQPYFNEKGLDAKTFCTRIGCSNYNLAVIVKNSQLSLEQLEILQGWNTPHRMKRYFLEKDSYRYRSIPYKTWRRFLDVLNEAIQQKQEMLK